MAYRSVPEVPEMTAAELELQVVLAAQAEALRAFEQQKEEWFAANRRKVKEAELQRLVRMRQNLQSETEAQRLADQLEQEVRDSWAEWHQRNNERILAAMPDSYHGKAKKVVNRS